MSKWTNEMLKEEALKYNTKNDFRKGSMGAHSASIRRGLLNEICSHMIIKRNIWTEELLRKEALKYNSRSEFSKKSNREYKASIKIGILDEICSHMIKLGNTYNRYIYIINFENNSVYIGITNNLERRKLEHIENSSNKHVRKLMNNRVKYTFNSNNILYDINDIGKMECSIIEKYKEKGYNVLNISKGGELGASNKWTYDIIKEEALKYNTRSDFEKNSGAYSSAIRQGLLDDVCSHMITQHITWSDDIIREEALKYNTRSDFMKNNVNAYNAASRRGILNDVCSHMIIQRIIWRDDMLRKEALKYITRSSFQKGSYGAYQTANKRGLLNDICSHMKKRNKESH